MKKLIFFVSLLVLLFWVFWISRQKKNIQRAPQIPKESVEIFVSPTSIDQKTIQDDGHEIAYSFFSSTPDRIRLFSNLKDSTDSASAKHMHTCASLINAGFYTKENTHLGLFIVNSERIHPAVDSALVDGFLSINQSDSATISFVEPTDSPRYAVQSGPVIRSNNSRITLKLIEDKFARRSLAGITADGKLVFITVYFSDQEYSGPLLARLPYILEKIQFAEGLHISDALNLDGGSASAFISEGTTLSEISPIGGYFCIPQKNTVQ